MAVTFACAKFMDAIDSIRKHYGLNTSQLAEKIDVSPSTLARMRRGEHPNVESLITLVSWSRLDLSEFIEGEAPVIAPAAQMKLVPEEGDGNGGGTNND
jgi:transcriptional regulator with XRE-family HTH domain